MGENEKIWVEEHSRIGGYSLGVNRYAMEYCGEIFLKFMKDGNVLELGPAEGVMTALLYPHFSDYTIVDGAGFFVEKLKERYPEMHCYASLFEEFSTDKRFDNIVLGHVLEHVESPVDILRRCRSWLADGGRVLSAVPNANSIHRQAAVHMGLLQSVDQLNDTDCRNGHRRVYDVERFKRDFQDAGFRILQSGGYWLKPLSNAQIERDWTDETIRAFLVLGEKYPEIAGEIYVVAGI